jgi:hypothetical protein
LLIQEGIITTTEGVIHQFTQPSQIFYEINHRLDYSKNETMRVLKKMGILSHDIITLYNEKTLDKVTLTYQEFIENIPCELF